jgi:hypothetical protein
MFTGRKRSFEKMVSKQHPCEEEPTIIKPNYTNMSIICHSDLIADGIVGLKEDCL